MKRVFNGWTLKILAALLLLVTAVFAKPETGETLNIIVFGAHPDDCELKAGGMAAKWAAAGHRVKFVSTTNGDIGHAKMAGGPLALRRTAEVEAAAEILNIETEVLDIHDGEIMPTLENRRTFVRLIREWNADIVIGHRPIDYHPDHRYTGILMQDAAFMVTVAYFCPGTPFLRKNPVFLFMSDRFQKPNPFEPDVVVSIDEVFGKKQDAVWTLESQIESTWATGAFVDIKPVPKDPAARAKRRKAQNERQARRDGAVADRFREKLLELYGEKEGKKVKYAEAFEVCEYGRQPDTDELKQMFLLKD